MPDRHSLRAPPRQRRTDPLVAAARVFEREQTSGSRSRELFASRPWQEEAWAFYENLGELAWAVDWLSKALSRVRLLAAVQTPGGDEPEPVDVGPAADAVARLGAGIGGHSRLLAALTIQLSVPGEGWLVGEATPAGGELWRVYSTAEIRTSSAVGSQYEVLEDVNEWRPLPAESHVTRVWDPSPKLHFEATSPVRAALPVMRRIDLLDRRIVSTLVSRLAMNGLLLIPQDGMVAVPSQYQGQDDPFVAMLLDIAANNMKHPGNASATIPLPVRFPAEFIDKWKHLTFADGITAELLEEREKELKRLATALNVPAEVILGLGDSNHWTAWLLEEAAIKIHVSPMAETICDALTRGYLHPMLGADTGTDVSADGATVVVWYDTSELTARPDRTEQAFAAYDRFELSGEALLRETGLNEADRPEGQELQDQILRRLAATVQLGWSAMQELTGGPAGSPTPPAGSTGGSGAGAPAIGPAGGTPTPTGGERGAPGTQGEPPPPPGQDASVAPWPVFITPDLPPRPRRQIPPATVNGGRPRHPTS